MRGYSGTGPTGGRVDRIDPIIHYTVWVITNEVDYWGELGWGSREVSLSWQTERDAEAFRDFHIPLEIGVLIVERPARRS